MTFKQVCPRARADLDAQEAVDYSLNEGAVQAAYGFVDALEQAFEHIGRHPASGATRYAHELGLPGLRSWPLRGYPYLVFFVELDDHVDVWRILHGERDIPVWLIENK